jgi:hypothetical protein
MALLAELLAELLARADQRVCAARLSAVDCRRRASSDLPLAIARISRSRDPFMSRRSSVEKSTPSGRATCALLSPPTIMRRA